ncbi:hypothetical protein H311_04122, partial [Anncaliia algerae PRA109]
MYFIYYLSNVYATAEIVSKWTTGYSGDISEAHFIGFDYFKTYYCLLKSLVDDKDHRFSNFITRNSSEKFKHLKDFRRESYAEEEIETVIHILKRLVGAVCRFEYLISRKIITKKNGDYIKSLITKLNQEYSKYLQEKAELAKALASLGSALEKIYNIYINDNNNLISQLFSYKRNFHDITNGPNNPIIN